MVRSAIGVGSVERWQIVVVVVKGGGLICVDVPGGGAGDLWGEGAIGQSVIEVTVLPFESVGVVEIAHKAVYEIGVSPLDDGPDRVFVAISVEITNDEKVGITAASGVGGQPVDFGAGGAGCARL